MRKAFAAGLCAIWVSAATSPPDPVPLPEWMSGCWVTQEDNSRTEECWTSPMAGTMVGAAVSARGSKLINWESMRLTVTDATTSEIPMLLVVQPKGAASVIFSHAADGKPGLTFYNRKNDFPQRVRYWREGDMLIGEIAMEDGSNAVRWGYRRKP